MSNLINPSFFVGDINIPNTSKLEVAESLNVFISKYEKDLLIKMLGYSLWKSYDTDPTTERFVNLINGVDEWRGLVYDISDTVKGSVIAYYVYCWWLKDKQTWNSGIGVVRPKGDQVDVMPIHIKMVDAWNTCSSIVGEFISYMSDSDDIYPEWNPCELWQLRPINDFDI